MVFLKPNESSDASCQMAYHSCGSQLSEAHLWGSLLCLLPTGCNDKSQAAVLEEVQGGSAPFRGFVECLLKPQGGEAGGQP